MADEPGSLGTILLVEDEPIVALVAQQVLEELGFHVTVAPHGEAALSHARSAFTGRADAPVFVLAVIDVGLPDISGVMVVHQIRDMAPALPIIIASGHAVDELELEFRSFEALTLLCKPYDGASLQHALGRMGFAVRDLGG